MKLDYRLFRVAKSHSYPWKRGYDEQFSEDIYTVVKIKDNLYRPLYQLADGNNKKTDDMYYQEELQKVAPDSWKISRVIKER